MMNKRATIVVERLFAIGKRFPTMKERAATIDRHATTIDDRVAKVAEGVETEDGDLVMFAERSGPVAERLGSVDARVSSKALCTVTTKS